jgi:hypothetical protein
MSTPSPAPLPARDAILPAPDVAPQKAIDGLGTLAHPDDETNKRLNEIEMMGEEEALGYRLAGPQHGITPGMRYLHSSRTINQLVIDRNRSVTIYLAVASLLWTATGAILHAQPKGRLMVPIEEVQLWCIPTTAAVLTALAVIVAFLLVRIRVGLIYEVAKMNVLLGLPIGRVRRLNPLSVFFIMYVMISMAGGAHGSFLSYHLLRYAFSPAAPDTHGDPAALPAAVPAAIAPVSILIGVLITAGLLTLFWAAVHYLTADPVLQARAGEARFQTPRPAMGSVIY